MAARVGQEQLTTFVTAVIQAERLGSNLGLVLRELAEDVRNFRMSRAEELANMMPTKMALPMALFMLPALFLMIFGGVVAQYLASNQ
jgi:tight adherence protein C